MDSSYNVIRRFTPPTCTLEILQKIPARYFWQSKQATEDYQFKLSFDDPRLLEEEAISLSGDQDKLERLCNLVSTYIEEFLARSFNDSTSSEVFSFQLSASELADEQLADDELVAEIDPSLEDSQLVDQAQLNQTYSSFALPELVRHRLDLDAVDSEADLSSISLSATQLFDLGSALDDYQEAMAVVLQEQKESQPKQSAIPGGVKALIGLATIALGLLGSRLFFQSRLQNQVASRRQEVNIPSESKVGADVVAPEISESAKQPVAKVQETPSLRDRERLPPPPAVTTPKPPPNIPDPAKFSPPEGSLSIPPWTPLPSQDQSAAGSASGQKNSSSQVNSSQTTSQDAGLKDTQVEATINIPPQTAEQAASESSISANKSPQTTVAEPGKQDLSTQNIGTQDSGEQFNDSKTEIARTTSSQKPATQESLAAKESQASIPNPEELSPRLSSGQLKLGEQAAADAEELLALQERKGADVDSKSGQLSPDDKFSGKDAYDSGELVQLQEIDSYFRNKWRSPQELKQTIEYRLILSQDGSVKRVIPIGKAAGIYLDRTNIPLRGEPFVSPLTEERDTITVRLLLSPDGEVRTFLE